MRKIIVLSFVVIFLITLISAVTSTIIHSTNVYFCTENGWEFYDSVQHGSIYYCTSPEDTHYRFPESNVDQCLPYRPSCEKRSYPIYCTDFENGVICDVDDECVGERIIAKDTDGGPEGDRIKCCEGGCESPNSLNKKDSSKITGQVIQDGKDSNNNFLIIALCVTAILIILVICLTIISKRKS